MDSPTTAWIRQASSPVNSSNVPSPPEKVPSFSSQDHTEASASSTIQRHSQGQSGCVSHTGPSRFSPAPHTPPAATPAASQHSSNAVAAGAWGAGPPRDTRPFTQASPGPSPAAAATAAAPPSTTSRLTGRPPTHPQPHALASTGSSRPSIQAQSQSPPRPPSRCTQSAGNHADRRSPTSTEALQVAAPDTLVGGLGTGQILLLGSPQSSNSSCSVTFSRTDGLVSPGPSAQPRSAPPTPSAHTGPTHRPNTPAKKRLSLVPTPNPPGHPLASNLPAPLACLQLMYDGPYVAASGYEPGTAATTAAPAADDAPIPLCTPVKVSISRASLQACSLTTVSVASSLEAQASSTEAVVTGLSSGIEASSPEAPSPGDASSPGTQFPARPVLGQTTSLAPPAQRPSSMHEHQPTWSAPSLSDALEAAAAPAAAASHAEQPSVEPTGGPENGPRAPQLGDWQAPLGESASEVGRRQPPVLCVEACQLADDYAAALATSSGVSLAAETELLLHMLAVPLHVQRSHGPAEQRTVRPGPVSEAGVRVDGPAEENSSAAMLESGWHAHIFACRVLERSGKQFNRRHIGAGIVCCTLGCSYAGSFEYSSADLC